MTDSSVFLQLWDARIQEDGLAVLQTGLAVLLDKPFLFVIPPGFRLPENLRRLARAVFEADISRPKDRERLAGWVAEQARLLGLEER